MRSTPLSFCLAAACFALLLCAAPSANAQCGVNTVGFSNAGIVTDNPFHAELVVTRTTNDEPATPTSSHAPELIARDSQGRVRTERATGQFLHENGADAGAKTEQHIIMICDPVTQTLTQIDTLSASAKIIRARPSAPNSPRPQGLPPRTFCSSRLFLNHRNQGEDLGVQTIEGVEAHGVRITMPPHEAPPPPTANRSSTPPAVTSVRFGAPTNFPPSCSRSCRICGPAQSPQSPCKTSSAPSRTRPSSISRAITPSANPYPSRADPHHHRLPGAAPSAERPTLAQTSRSSHRSRGSLFVDTELPDPRLEDYSVTPS